MKKVRNLQKLIPLLPLLLLAILFIFLPIISMIQKSFLSPETGAFTFNNYKTIFTDSVYQVATSNSLYLSYASTIFVLILSFFIAWAVNELGNNGQSRMLSMLNMVSNFAGLPLYFSFVVILGNTGIFVLALRAIGIQLSTVFRLYSIQGLLLMFIYFQLPLGSLMLVPAFQAVDSSWKEAADKKLLVSREALVIPIRTGRAVAGTPPEIRTSLLASVKSVISMRVPMRRSVSPGSMTRTLRII